MAASVLRSSQTAPACNEDWLAGARAGHDAEFPAWLDRQQNSEAPSFDSVVIRGSGVSALTCAARLARSSNLRGRVLVAGERPSESPKLINGCTLRARSLDYLAAAVGQSPERILDILLGDLAPQARSTRQFFSMFSDASRGYETIRLAEFMPQSASRGAYAYGLRNSRLVGGLTELTDELGLHWTDGKEVSLADCRAAGSGDSPFVVNGSHQPLEGAPQSTPPAAFVVAWQCTMKRRADSVLPVAGSMIAGIRQPAGIDIGVFYPFADPLTRDADAYGLFYRVVHPDSGYQKEDVIEEMRAHVLGVGASIGWELVDEDRAAAGAQVPGFAWSDVENTLPDYFDLHRTFGAGLPIITGCGMTRGALAGWLTAESLMRGEPPATPVNRSLHRWRRLNRGFCAGMEDRTGIAAALLNRFPARLVGLLADRRDVWASVHGGRQSVE
ncbi:MAG: hypothetical protein ABGX04_06725 [Myxococcales bacterium]